MKTPNRKTSKIAAEEETLEVLRKIGDELARGCPVGEELILALRHISEKLLTRELCLKAVKEFGLVIQYLPVEFVTPELCREAVKQNGKALEYVPGNIRTAEFVLEAMEQNGNALKYLPENLKMAELCLKTVKDCGYALEYVPNELKTAEMCLEAVKQNGMALDFVLPNLKTASPKEFGALCLEAAKQNGWVLETMPPNLITAELCLEAVEQDDDALRFVPKALLKEVHRFEKMKDKVCSVTDKRGIENNLKSKREERVLLHTWGGEVIDITDDLKEAIEELELRKKENGGLFEKIKNKLLKRPNGKQLEPEPKERIIQRTFFGEVIDITEDVKEFILKKENRKKKKKK